MDPVRILGPLPGGLPHFEVEYGQASGPYTLLAIIPANAGIGTQYLTAVDPNGNVVWYIPLPAHYGNVGDCQTEVRISSPGSERPLSCGNASAVGSFGYEIRNCTRPVV